MNETMAQISDLAFEAALAGYVVALVCYAIELASRRGGRPVRWRNRPTPRHSPPAPPRTRDLRSEPWSRSSRLHRPPGAPRRDRAVIAGPVRAARSVWRTLRRTRPGRFAPARLSRPPYGPACGRVR